MDVQVGPHSAARQPHFAVFPSPPSQAAPVTLHSPSQPPVVTLFDGDDQVATGRVTRTLPLFFSMDETVDIGSDLATPVSGDYGPTGNEFTGTIVWLRIDLGDDDHTHLADPEHVEFDALWRRSVIARCRRQGTVLACPRNHAALPTL